MSTIGGRERGLDEARRRLAEEEDARERDPYTNEERAFVRKLRRVLAQKPDGIALLACRNGGLSVRRRRWVPDEGQMCAMEALDSIIDGKIGQLDD